MVPRSLEPTSVLAAAFAFAASHAVHPSAANRFVFPCFHLLAPLMAGNHYLVRRPVVEGQTQSGPDTFRLGVGPCDPREQQPESICARRPDGQSRKAALPLLARTLPSAGSTSLRNR